MHSWCCVCAGIEFDVLQGKAVIGYSAAVQAAAAAVARAVLSSRSFLLPQSVTFLSFIYLSHPLRSSELCIISGTVWKSSFLHNLFQEEGMVTGPFRELLFPTIKTKPIPCSDVILPTVQQSWCSIATKRLPYEWDAVASVLLLPWTQQMTIGQPLWGGDHMQNYIQTHLATG